jgi:hypothetical protein
LRWFGTALAQKDLQGEIMTKREQRNNNLYFAFAILLLVLALQGFLQTAAALSASEPLTEFSTRSRHQEQIRELQRQQQINFLQDQQGKLQIQQDFRKLR